MPLHAQAGDLFQGGICCIYKGSPYCCVFNYGIFLCTKYLHVGVRLLVLYCHRFRGHPLLSVVVGELGSIMVHFQGEYGCG